MAFSFPRLPFPRWNAAAPSPGAAARARAAPGASVWPRFGGAGGAGPRRLVGIVAVAVGVAGVLAAATFMQGQQPFVSRPGRLPDADPVPGGVNSNPHQDNLAVLDGQEAAKREMAAGRSFTPQMPSGQAYSDLASKQPLLTAPPVSPAPAPPPRPAPARAAPAAAPPAPADAARVVKVADRGSQGQTGQQGQPDPRYKAAIDKLMGGWGNRPPRTDVILPPEAAETPPPGGGRPADAASGSVSQASARPGRRVLIPAARGVQAHVVMGANSDAPGAPVILEADSGPIARARLIGGFSRQGEHLVIRGNTIVHNGQEISAEWIVVSPSSREVTVASSVDQHYPSRFLLPAAAAFVQGLGQAFALSNSSVVASPFGGLSAFQRLNLGQQVGIGAGVAAGRVGQALDQAAPRGPTVRVEEGASVGVVFLSAVTVPD